MRSDSRRPLWLAVLIACVAALAVAGCGGDDNDDGGSGGGQTVTGAQNSGEDGQQGGDLTYLTSGDVDYMDPGQTYYTFGYMVQYAVNRTLYSFTPENSQDPVPDLAEGEPQISQDNKTITIKLKQGVKFAPPVDREVTSADIKYAIERAFTTSVPSGYSTAYFGEIEGAPEDPVKYSALKPFSGLQTPDDQTLVIKLTEPVAQRVAAALVMPITVPVPQEYAEKFDSEVPSTYNTNVAFTGPYMVENDESGELTGFKIGKQIKLVRNPNWDAETDYRPAYLDSITIQEGNDDLQVAARRTLSGQTTLCCDQGQLPPAVLRDALQKQDQLGTVPSGGTRWVALNTSKPPFDNVNVRKAVVSGFDRNALRLTRGGETIGPIAQSFIPPGIPGHEESGGEEGFTDFDWMGAEEGDQETFKKYMLEAAKDGVPVDKATGKYTGDDPITIVGDNADPGLATSTVAQQEFERLGFKTEFRKVSRDTMYTKFCGVPKEQPNVCPSVGWFKDFTDPESMLSPTFNGDEIKAAGNVNWSQLDVPEINDAMQEAAQTAGDERNQAWADINKMIVEQAPGIPYIWDDAFYVSSPDMALVVNGYYTTPDLNFTSVK